MYLYLILIKAHILVVGSFGDESFFLCVYVYYMIFLKRLFFQWVWDPGLASARFLLYHWQHKAIMGSIIMSLMDGHLATDLTLST